MWARPITIGQLHQRNLENLTKLKMTLTVQIVDSTNSVRMQKTPQSTARSFAFVEVPRIELGSDDIDQGLLRAQPL